MAEIWDLKAASGSAIVNELSVSFTDLDPGQFCHTDRFAGGSTDSPGIISRAFFYPDGQDDQS